MYGLGVSKYTYSFYIYIYIYIYVYTWCIRKVMRLVLFFFIIYL